MDIIILVLICSLQAQLGLTISTQHVRAISPSDHHRNIPLPPDKINWEIGLKEATYQALQREQLPDPNLRDNIYATPVDGYQNSATPFGDIAILARGQLYSTPHGYHFVQDPYQNDCDDCHNTAYRCERQQCEPQNWHNLVALWTVKRIRHRDPKFGHRYELQYTISPMSPAGNAEFVTRNGRFDYAIPGHVFVVKLKNNGATSDFHSDRSNYKYLKNYGGSHKTENGFIWTHHNDEYYNPTIKTQTHYQHTPNSILLNSENYHLSENDYKPGFFIGISPNGYKHIVHDIPEYVTEKPDKQPKPEESTNKEPIKHYHHHFYIPEVSDIDEYQKKTIKPVLPTVLTTTKEHSYTTSHAHTSTNNPQKVLLTTQHSSSQFIPNSNPTQYITHHSSEYIPSNPTQYIVSNPTTAQQIFTQETTPVIHPLTTVDHGYAYKTTFKYPETTIPITLNPVTLLTDVKFPTHTTNPTYPKTTLVKFYTVPTPTPTQPTPFNPSPFYIQYSEPDPTYNNNEPPTVSTYVTQAIHPTIQPTTATFVTIPEEPQRRTPTVHIYEDVTTPEGTTPTPIKSTKRIKYPDSINVQLPPPEKGTDTTIPYVASTAVTIITTSTIPPTLQNTEVITTQKDVDKTTTEIETETTLANKDYEDHIETNPTTIKAQSTESIPNHAASTSEEQLTDSLTSPSSKLITTTEETFTTVNQQSENIFTPTYTTRKITKTTPTYSDDFDIFGEMKEPRFKTTKAPKTTKLLPVNKPNAFDEIFSNFKTSGETQKKLAPGTTQSVNNQSLRNARLSKYLKYKRDKTNRLSSTRATSLHTTKTNQNSSVNDNSNASNDIETKTSQSFITSISFKVNKIGNKSEPSSTRQPEVTKSNSEADYIDSKNKNESEDLINTSTSEKSHTFDDIARSLVNHARVATFLKEKPTLPTKYRKSYEK